VKISNVFDAFTQPSKDSEFPFERVSSKEQVKYSMVIHLLVMPVGICHRDLVEICQQGLDNTILSHFLFNYNITKKI